MSINFVRSLRKKVRSRRNMVGTAARSRVWLGVAAVTAGLLLLGLDQTATALTTANWVGVVGGGDGISYNDPANWDIGVVPVNGGPDLYEVFIPAGETVAFDVPGAGLEVFQLTLGNSADLTIDPGRSLTVQDSLSIGGTIDTANGTLLATSASTMFTGTSARLLVSAGGNVELGAPTFTSLALRGGWKHRPIGPARRQLGSRQFP